MKWAGIFGVVATVLSGVIKMVSPEVRTLVGNFTTQLRVTATKTNHPFDTVLADLLDDLFNIPQS